MDAQLKQKWVDALRSGEYQQTRGVLHANGAFCCLGVLANLCGVEISKGGDGLIVDGLNDSYNAFDGILGGFRFSELADRNDGIQTHRPHSFPQIADYIEAAIPADPA